MKPDTPPKIIDDSNHTILIIGKGETGKTTLAKRILVNLDQRGIQYFVLDPVRQYGHRYGKVFNTKADLQGAIPHKSIFQWRTLDDFDTMCYWLFQYSIKKPIAKPVYVLIEEAQISIGQKRQHPLIDLVLTGRGNGVKFIIINRALVGLSSAMFDSATMFLIFALNNELTLKKLRERYNILSDPILALKGHDRKVYKV